MWLTDTAFRLFRSEGNRPQRGGVENKVVTFIYGPNIVIESWKAGFALSLISKQRTPPYLPKSPNDFFTILTAWQTLSNSIVTKPVWRRGKEKKTRGKQRHHTWMMEEDAVTSRPNLLVERTSVSICFHLGELESLGECVYVHVKACVS